MLNVSHENDLIFLRMNVQVTYIFIPIVSHIDSFCHRGKSKLGIGLFIHELLREPLIYLRYVSCLRCAFLFTLCFFVCVVLFYLRCAFLFALCFFVCVMLFYLRWDFLAYVLRLKIYIGFLALNSFLFWFGDVFFFCLRIPFLFVLDHLGHVVGGQMNH